MLIMMLFALMILAFVFGGAYLCWIEDPDPNLKYGECLGFTANMVFAGLPEWVAKSIKRHRQSPAVPDAATATHVEEVKS